LEEAKKLGKRSYPYLSANYSRWYPKRIIN
jgi:hypothetical protein